MTAKYIINTKNHGDFLIGEETHNQHTVLTYLYEEYTDVTIDSIISVRLRRDIETRTAYIRAIIKHKFDYLETIQYLNSDGYDPLAEMSLWDEAKKIAVKHVWIDGKTDY
jgi:hypothetical protein